MPTAETPEGVVQVFNKSRAINQGIKAAQGDVLSFLDCDAIVGDRWMEGPLRLLTDAGKDITRLCYRVRYLPEDFAELTPGPEADNKVAGAFRGYENGCQFPKGHEGYASPEIPATGCWDPNLTFGNSQFSIRRDVLGETRCDEAFIGAGYEDLAFIAAIWFQAGAAYKGLLYTAPESAMFHIRNKRLGSWDSDYLNHENYKRYKAMFAPPIDVIIPTCKTREEVLPLIAEIEKTAGRQVNVIATCKQLSASCNRNIGLDQAVSDPRIMIDDDITGLPQDWLVALTKVLEDNPECVMVSPQLIKPDGDFALMMGCPMPKAAGAGTRAAEGPHLLTACIAIRKDDLRFDENFVGSGWEDNDYCDRQAERYPEGVRVIQHDIQVVHRNEMKNQPENFVRNREYYLKTRSTPR